MPAVFNINAPNYTGFRLAIVGSVSVSPFTGLPHATIAHVTLEGSAVRFRLDGVTAHSGTGHLASAGDVIDLQGSEVISGFRVICGDGSATLMASIGHM